MVDESSIKQWLSHSNYLNPRVTFREIMNVINQYPGLNAQRVVYLFTDGTLHDLMSLLGTIPVKYKGSTYNIPICMCIVRLHPEKAPACYVRPTPEMSIKISQHVDQNGRIYLPYLQDWKPGTSDILGLIQAMIETFGRLPPVFTRREVAVPNSSN